MLVFRWLRVIVYVRCSFVQNCIASDQDSGEFFYILIEDSDDRTNVVAVHVVCVCTIEATN